MPAGHPGFSEHVERQDAATLLVLDREVGAG
ncbi:hypothetical protein N798_13890 [Knoellia flava TL1]|uniref:Uncharacterized protein n=1 Tax=Knoellia flava TL1 TaxID=1385518 RepID=A0ABR4XAW0_9MICO|nr:hypothetical protein N798_13890 [Knoellia flava TL1]